MEGHMYGFGDRAKPHKVSNGALLCLQQTHKACLLKVMVGREGFQQPPLLHDHKTRAINETPLLVWPLGKQLPHLGIKRYVHMHYLDIWRCFQPLDESNDVWVGNP